MHKIFFSFLILVIFTTILFAQNKTNIAVMDLSGEGISTSETRIISSRLRTDLFNTNKFTVVEREAMEEILQEQGLQLSGCTSNECVVEAGKLLGVRRIVAGEIGKIGNLFTLSIRIIDVETGKILKTATEDCECDIEKVLVSSVKNAAELLAGKKIISSSYSTVTKEKNDQEISNDVNEWELLGISRSKYIKFKRSGLTFEEWQLSVAPKRKKIYLTMNVGNYPADKPSRFIGSMTLGYNFTEQFQMGIGANILQLWGYSSYPIFFDARYSFFKNNFSPYLLFDSGYSFLGNNTGFMLNCGLGTKIKFHLNYGFILEFYYRLQESNFKDLQTVEQDISKFARSFTFTFGLLFE